MKKNLNNTSKARKAIRLINGGLFWEKAAEIIGLSVSYLRKLVKATYTREGDYRRLCEKAKANKAAHLASISIIDPVIQEIKEVIVVETGYLLQKGVQGILAESLDIFIPLFCIKELERLSNSSAAASEVLEFIYSWKRVTPIDLRGSEILFEEPSFPVKARTIGIVAVACELLSLDYRVRVLTNSYEVEELCKAQDCGIEVVRISPR